MKTRHDLLKTAEKPTRPQLGCNARVRVQRGTDENSLRYGKERKQRELSQ